MPFQSIDLCYNVSSTVLICTRFPTSHKGEAGPTDRRGNLYNLKTWAALSLSVLLLVFASLQKGVGNMTNSVAVEFAVYFAIAVGSRVQVRT